MIIKKWVNYCYIFSIIYELFPGFKFESPAPTVNILLIFPHTSEGGGGAFGQNLFLGTVYHTILTIFISFFFSNSKHCKCRLFRFETSNGQNTISLVLLLIVGSRLLSFILEHSILLASMEAGQQSL